jgi:AcrR family transcriptional regulator
MPRIRKTIKKAATRTRLPPEDRVEHILDVALDLFSRQGFHDVTTRDIADACKVNVALIYYYFKSKDVLVQAVIERSIRIALERYRQRVVEGTSPVDALDEWFRINLELFQPLKKMAQVLVVYSTTGPRKASIDALIRNLYRNEEQILRVSIEAGVRQGLFRRLDPAQAATFISTHLDGLFFVAMTRPDIDMRERTEAAWTEVWAYLGVRRTPASRI